MRKNFENQSILNSHRSDDHKSKDVSSETRCTKGRGTRCFYIGSRLYRRSWPVTSCDVMCLRDWRTRPQMQFTIATAGRRRVDWTSTYALVLWRRSVDQQSFITGDHRTRHTSHHPVLILIAWCLHTHTHADFEGAAALLKHTDEMIAYFVLS